MMHRDVIAVHTVQNTVFRILIKIMYFALVWKQS